MYAQTGAGGENATGATSWLLRDLGTLDNPHVIDLFAPAAAAATSGTLIGYPALPAVQVYGIGNSSATGYDGFSLITSTGTITGTVYVYGYRNS